MSEKRHIHPSPLRAGTGAFTLVELLAALGIFAFAALGLMLALETTITAARATQRENEIRAQMESRLARLEVGPLQEVSNKDEFEGVTYLEEVKKEEEILNSEQERLSGFWRVKVTAQWKESNDDQEWSSGHLVYQP